MSLRQTLFRFINHVESDLNGHTNYFLIDQIYDIEYIYELHKHKSLSLIAYQNNVGKIYKYFKKNVDNSLISELYYDKACCWFNVKLSGNNQHNDYVQIICSMNENNKRRNIAIKKLYKIMENCKEFIDIAKIYKDLILKMQYYFKKINISDKDAIFRLSSLKTSFEKIKSIETKLKKQIINILILYEIEDGCDIKFNLNYIYKNDNKINYEVFDNYGSDDIFMMYYNYLEISHASNKKNYNKLHPNGQR